MIARMRLFPACARVLAGLALSGLAPHAAAQSTASFPEPEPTVTAPPAPAPPPAPAAPPSKAPAPAPAPVAPAPAPVAPTPAAAPVAPVPAPAPVAPAPVAPTPAEPPGSRESPPPPAPPGRKIPEISIRVDAINLVMGGDLNLELEVGLLRFLSVEVVPSFVVNENPPTHGYVSGLEEQLERKANGLGPLAGATFDVGFWLNGRAMRGTVLRVMFMTHSYEYESSDNAGVFDRVRVTERVLGGFLGSQWRAGAFTVAGGFGLGGVIGGQRRCFTANELPTMHCRKNQLLIQVERHRHVAPEEMMEGRIEQPLVVADLNGFLGSVRSLGRLSLGVVF